MTKFSGISTTIVISFILLIVVQISFSFWLLLTSSSFLFPAITRSSITRISIFYPFKTILSNISTIASFIVSSSDASHTLITISIQKFVPETMLRSISSTSSTSQIPIVILTILLDRCSTFRTAFTEILSSSSFGLTFVSKLNTLSLFSVSFQINVRVLVGLTSSIEIAIRSIITSISFHIRFVNNISI